MLGYSALSQLMRMATNLTQGRTAVNYAIYHGNASCLSILLNHNKVR